MYRLTLTKLFFFISIVVAYAQAPIVDSNWFPKAGDKYYLYSIDNQNPSTANDTGANVTWDFSRLLFQYYPDDSFDYDYASNRNITCHNSSCNLIDGNLIKYGCYLKNSTGFYLSESNYTTDSFDIINSKPELLMKSGFQFRQHLWDTTKYYYRNPFQYIDSPWRGIITSHRIYDGFGILKLPGMQYDSAIRIHIISTDKDTIPDPTYDDNNNNRHDSAIDYKDYYEWYVPSIHYWVLKIFNIKETNWENGVYDTVRVVKYLYGSVPIDAKDAEVQQLKDITANYGQNNIVLHNIMYNNLLVAVYDTQGKQIYAGKPELIGNGMAVVPLAVSQGMYLIKVQNSRGNSKAFKLVKTD